MPKNTPWTFQNRDFKLIGQTDYNLRAQGENEGVQGSEGGCGGLKTGCTAPQFIQKPFPTHIHQCSSASCQEEIEEEKHILQEDVVMYIYGVDAMGDSLSRFEYLRDVHCGEASWNTEKNFEFSFEQDFDFVDDV